MKKMMSLLLLFVFVFSVNSLFSSNEENKTKMEERSLQILLKSSKYYDYEEFSYIENLSLTGDYFYDNRITDSIPDEAEMIIILNELTK